MKKEELKKKDLKQVSGGGQERIPCSSGVRCYRCNEVESKYQYYGDAAAVAVKYMEAGHKCPHCKVFHDAWGAVTLE